MLGRRKKRAVKIRKQFDAEAHAKREVRKVIKGRRNQTKDGNGK